ncbi:hypothetical protein [Streptomyces sp. 142MFCol3.1]|uniref:hypothetical protein n=1 Tax=Streptomyces sp. 142MFCol3.1 TaxID=1172179 RepID=UPI00040A7ABD|nr:hypothetical protein [Streptomyces sp. 142MFCol3.1]
MPTSPLSFRPAPSRTAAARAGAAVALAALTAAGAAVLGTPAAFAAPGDSGDVTVHRTTTSVRDQKVCGLYLDASDFDASQSVSWSIAAQPPVVDGSVLSGTLALPASGHGRTADLVLPTGQYKLTWAIAGGNGAGKHKVFKVDCAGAPLSPTATVPGAGTGGQGGPGAGPGGLDGGPNGGPAAGGGGLARTQDFSPVAGAAAVGLVVTGGVVYLRLRRRTDGAA